MDRACKERDAQRLSRVAHVHDLFRDFFHRGLALEVDKNFVLICLARLDRLFILFLLRRGIVLLLHACAHRLGAFKFKLNFFLTDRVLLLVASRVACSVLVKSHMRYVFHERRYVLFVHHKLRLQNRLNATHLLPLLPLVMHDLFEHLHDFLIGDATLGRLDALPLSGIACIARSERKRVGIENVAALKVVWFGAEDGLIHVQLLLHSFF